MRKPKLGLSGGIITIRRVIGEVNEIQKFGTKLQRAFTANPKTLTLRIRGFAGKLQSVHLRTS